MTAAGIILNAVTLILMAAVCYAVALLLYLRQRRLAKGVDMSKGPKDAVGAEIHDEATGILLENNIGFRMKNVRILGYKRGLVAKGNQDSEITCTIIADSQKPSDETD